MALENDSAFLLDDSSPAAAAPVAASAAVSRPLGWQVEQIGFPAELPLRLFLHDVRDVGLHLHSAFELLLVLRGEVELHTATGLQRVLAGDLALVHAGEPHASHDLGGANLVLCLQLDPASARHDPEFRRRRFQIEGLNNEPGLRPLRDRLRGLLASMMWEQRLQRPGWKLEIEAGVLQLVSCLIRGLPSALGPEAHPMLLPEEEQALGRRLQRVCQYVHDHVAEPISVGEVAQALGWSSGYLARLFKAETGNTFGQFITLVRLRRALDALSRPAIGTLLEVALSCGFPNAKAFNLAFRRALGCTPGEWRLAHRAIPGHAGRTGSAYGAANELDAMRLLQPYVAPSNC